MYPCTAPPVALRKSPHTIRAEHRSRRAPDMILEEGFPGLRGWPLDGLQDARHRPFGDLDSELLQFAMNAVRTPQGIGFRQSANQCANVRTEGRPALFRSV